ncbi:Heavy metal transport/detoxification superfamily protein [Rhynchospora pubera]|uniref:Heavy metal transport/detoxification superfamily protein n=1 Tax=Rhynchospora pubera TaxID=906938 RepID=A0AAV8G903_9POAL|nr:Heavy metal transport/detoxification superfamily protein [Rhynchospora pubera]
MADMQIVLAGKKIEPQYVEMKVPLYSYGCEKKITKALSRLRGIHSVHVDYDAQKVTVWGICNRDDVLAAIRTKRRDAYFWDQPESKNASYSMRYDQVEPTRSSRVTTALIIYKFRKSWRKLFPLVLY